IVLAVTTGSGVTPGSDARLGPNTWAEIALTLIGVAAVVATLLYGTRAKVHGTGALIAFALLTALTAVSIAWSVQPDVSWSAANQIVAYLATFAAAIALARLAPERWTAILGA